ncbi:MaoC/PaaZ C-terminal domain-containing protein [Zhengella sp. ZM62]|uniref:MaoC/PaaZ C-terminal domain-containing protein n=1 Tax=Zhengella sedimenti TaxID=3390035 RepID=UPI003976CD5A
MTLGEKLALGTVHQLGTHTFTPDEIVAFASRYDPQRFHLSEEEAAKTHFGRLCASGWHTAAIWMSRNVAADKALAERLRAAGETSVEFGPALGLKNVRWTAPVFAGDTISFTRCFLNLKPLGKRPGWFLAAKHCEAFNAAGKKVMEFDSAQMLRDGAA